MRERFACNKGEIITHTGHYSPPGQTKLLPFDHVYPPASGLLYLPSRTAILYGDITSPNFRSLHNYMYALAKEDPPRIQYVYRHIPPRDGQTVTKSYLSGFGVTMDLKKMDYLALDDRGHSRDSGKNLSAVISLLFLKP